MRLCTIIERRKAVSASKNDDGKIIDCQADAAIPKSVVEILAGGKKVQAEVDQGLPPSPRPAHGVGEVGKVPAAIPTRARSCASGSTPQACRGDRQPIPTYPVVFCRFRQHAGAAQRQDAATQPIPTSSTWEAESPS